jgi:hypothetical protein
LNETVVRRLAQASRRFERNTGSEPGFEKYRTRVQCFSLFPASNDKDLCDKAFDASRTTGEGSMRTEQRHEHGLAGWDGPPQIGGHSYGAEVTCSDTIKTDSCVPFISFWKERRQTEHAARWSASIPCFRNPHSTTDFPFWIQPVAAESEKRLRQLNRDDARPDKAGGKMANYCRDLFCLHDFSRGIPETEDAATKANPEVTRCR